MSGPKVIDIRAIRRQMQRKSAACLRQLGAAVEECLALLGGREVEAAELRSRTGNLLSRLEEMRAAENYAGVLNEAIAYREFYQGEAQRLKLRWVEQRRAEYRREHRRQQLARQLRAELQQLPRSPEAADLLSQLDSAEVDLTAVQGLLEKVAAVRSDRAATVESARLRAAAQSYLDSAANQATASLAQTEPDPDETRLERCWSVLGELETAAGPAAVQEWQQRVRAAANAVGSERTLLLDSVALELAETFRAAREQRVLNGEAEALLAELASIQGPAAEAQRTLLSEALRQTPVFATLRETLAAATSWLSEYRAAEDARAQRSAILEALASLGYEVREGMATAWVEQGRIVVHKPNETTYGVELAAPATGSAFQARVVTAAAGAGHRQRDKEVEETWCAELTKVRELVARDGFQTTIVQAKEPGAVPLKVTPVQEPADRRNLLRSPPRSRTLD